MAGPAFIADPPEQVRRLELDGLTALYHRSSGITHIVAPPAPQILDALATGEAGAAEILRRMRESFELNEDGEAEAVIAARLAELEAAGLVRRA